MVLALVGSGEVGVMWLVKSLLKSRLGWTNLVKWEQWEVTVKSVKWERATVVEVEGGEVKWVVKCVKGVVKCVRWVVKSTP